MIIIGQEKKAGSIALITGLNHQHSNTCDCMYKKQYSQLNVMGMHLWLQWMHLNLIFCSRCPCTEWADYWSEYNIIIAANQSAVRYFVAPNKPCKWSGILAQAIQLTAVQDVDVTLHVL